MATLEDCRRIASTFPEVVEQVDGHRGGAAWRTKRGLILWERGPSKADIVQLAELGRTYPEGPVVAIRAEGEAREALLSAYPDVFFTIPHFDGYPAVLARLEVLDAGMLAELFAEAWLSRVSKRVGEQWLEENELET